MDENNDLSSVFPPRDVMSVAAFIKGHLETIKDEGTGIDTGGGMGCRDLWVKIDGLEYFVSVTRKPVVEVPDALDEAR